MTPKFVSETLPDEYTVGLSDHAKMCLYLVLHDLALAGDEDAGKLPLKHLEWAKLLPRIEQMRTAMWFNDAEHDLLRGSNLYPAIDERRAGWQDEHKAVLNQPALAHLKDKISW